MRHVATLRPALPPVYIIIMFIIELMVTQVSTHVVNEMALIARTWISLFVTGRQTRLLHVYSRRVLIGTFLVGRRGIRDAERWLLADLRHCRDETATYIYLDSYRDHRRYSCISVVQFCVHIKQHGVCMRAFVRTCVRASVRACVRVYTCILRVLCVCSFCYVFKQ